MPGKVVAMLPGRCATSITSARVSRAYIGLVITAAEHMDQIVGLPTNVGTIGCP